MTQIDIYLFLTNRNDDACNSGKLGKFLKTLDGVGDVREIARRKRRLLQVLYDPHAGSPANILKAAERIGCRAKLIGL